MHLALLIVGIILFAIDAVAYWVPNPPAWGGRLQSLGLVFFAASFLPGLPQIMLWLLVCLLLLIWLLGWSVFSLVPLIHLLLVLVVILVIYNLLVGRGAPPP